MWSKVKNTFITLLVLTSIVTIAIIVYSKDRTYYNDDSVVGNSLGNIYNGGLFCEHDNLIFFSNDNDDGSLYVMKSDGLNAKKLHNDKASFINADDNYIYYVRANNTKENKKGSMPFNNTGIYRINYNGKKLKSITSNPGSYLTLQGNYLYFQKYDVENGLLLFRNKIDGSSERQLVKDAAIPMGVYAGELYYTAFSNNHNINKVDLLSFTRSTYLEGNFAYPIIHGEYIYYLDLDDNYSLYRMKLGGSKPTKLIDERLSTYNITNSGTYIYYQVDDSDNSRIERLNMNNMEIETLLYGNFKQIHVTDAFVFFKDYDNTNTYMQVADGRISISTFEPPIITE